MISIRFLCGLRWRRSRSFAVIEDWCASIWRQDPRWRWEPTSYAASFGRHGEDPAPATMLAIRGLLLRLRNPGVGAFGRRQPARQPVGARSCSTWDKAADPGRPRHRRRRAGIADRSRRRRPDRRILLAAPRRGHLQTRLDGGGAPRPGRVRSTERAGRSEMTEKGRALRPGPKLRLGERRLRAGSTAPIRARASADRRHRRPAASTSPGSSSRLGALHAEGVLSDAEFAAAKARVVGGRLRPLRSGSRCRRRPRARGLR